MRREHLKGSEGKTHDLPEKLEEHKNTEEWNEKRGDSRYESFVLEKGLCRERGRSQIGPLIRRQKKGFNMLRNQETTGQRGLVWGDEVGEIDIHYFSPKRRKQRSAKTWSSGETKDEASTYSGE